MWKNKERNRAGWCPSSCSCASRAFVLVLASTVEVHRAVHLHDLLEALRSVALARKLLVCPACRGTFAKQATDWSAPSARYDVRDGIPDLRVPSDTTTDLTVRWLLHRGALLVSAARQPRVRVRGPDGAEFARPPDRAIPGDANVVEVLRYSGQMSLFPATADRVVIGADLSAPRCRSGPPRRVASGSTRRGSSRRISVARAFARARSTSSIRRESRTTRPTPAPRRGGPRAPGEAGGIVVLGLYNTWARIPHRLRRAVGRLTGFKWVLLDARAPRSRRRARATRSMASRPVPAPRRAPAHAARGAAMVSRAASRTCARTPDSLFCQRDARGRRASRRRTTIGGASRTGWRSSPDEDPRPRRRALGRPRFGRKG